MTLLKSCLLVAVTAVLILVMHQSDRASAGGPILSPHLGLTADINTVDTAMPGITRVAAGRRASRVAGPGIRGTRRGVGPGIHQTRRGVRPGTRRARRLRRSRVFRGFFPYSSNGGYHRSGLSCRYLADCPCRFLAGC